MKEILTLLQLQGEGEVHLVTIGGFDLVYDGERFGKGDGYRYETLLQRTGADYEIELPVVSARCRKMAVAVMLTTRTRIRKSTSTELRIRAICRIQIFLTASSATPASIKGTQRDRRLPVEHGSSHLRFFGGGVCHRCGRFIRRQVVLLHRLAKLGGWAMLDVRASKRLTKAIIARREIQRHLECLTRQIKARAGRQMTTVKARRRLTRRSGPRICHQQLVDRLIVERWVALDIIHRRLIMQESVIGELQHRDK